MGKKITIELSERQARIVLRAVEEWFRIRMGQNFDLANDLAFYGYKKDEKHPEQFDFRIQTRDHLNEVIKSMFRIAWPHYGTPESVDPEVNVASDIWSVLRYELGPKNDWSSRPFQMSTEPLPKVIVEVET